MIKLYCTVRNQLRYHEAWIGNDRVHEHWGAVGSRGKKLEHTLDESMSEEANIERVLSQARAKGFEALDEFEEDHSTVMVVYTIDGMGSRDDLDKRHALEDHLNEVLGWTGVGHVDGGSIGAGTMEVFCIVVDVDIATRTIAKNLADTPPFEDYSSIAAQ